MATPSSPWVEVADSGRALGTTYHVLLVVRPQDQARAKLALRQTRQLVAKLKLQFSEWLSTSEISRINQQAGRRWVPLSREMRRLLVGSLHISRVTGGAFDITWAPWGAMWRKAQRLQRLPSPQQRAEIRKAIGWQQVQIGAKGIRFRHPGTKLGIAGVAKGWIIDRAFHHLRAAGFRHIVVNIGGDLRTSGLNHKDQKRRFYISDPRHPKRFIGMLRVSDMAIATSGNYLRYRRVGKQRYGHIIDPRTGFPPAFVGSVTVLTRDATMADALATAMFVMGPKQGLALARRTPGLEVVFATSQGLRASFAGVKRLVATPTTQRSMPPKR